MTIRFKTKAATTSAASNAAKPAIRLTRSSRPKSPTSAPPAPAQATKRDQVAALLIRDEGATIEQMIAATGWLPHTVRAALTGLKKLGYAVDSDKVDGIRTYRAVAPR